MQCLFMNIEYDVLVLCNILFFGYLAKFLWAVSSLKGWSMGHGIVRMFMCRFATT